MEPDDLRGESTVDALPEEEQDRLARILDDYLVAAELGTPITPEELLARHPHDAERLRGYLSGLRLFHDVAVDGKTPRATGLAAGGLRPAEVIGDFRLVREIGRGGMGIVYEAEQLSLRRRVALKILPFTAGRDSKQIGRFKNEAQAAAQVKHPNIVPVYAVGEENGVHYYAMQLIEGKSLTTLVAAPADDSPSSLADTCRRVQQVARLGVQAAEALHAAHEYGVLHRDVKPSNLLVDEAGKLWVTDFGLARCRESSGLTHTGDILGTTRYMSPEQALGQGALIDQRTDVYSLGVTLYELATHRHPAGDVTDAQLLLDRRRFTAKPLRHWNCHIPVDFQTIVLKAIAEFPQERYTTAQEFADDLNRFLANKPILASPPSLLSRAGKWVHRHRGMMSAAAAILLVAVVGQFVNTLLLAHQKHATEMALAAAQDNLQQAHSVLNEFAAEYAGQLAAVPGAEGVRAEIIRDSLEFYEQFAAQTPALSTDLARAYDRIGTLTEQLGNDGDALARHQAAREIWQSRSDKEPGNADLARNLALCDNSIGLLLSKLGRHAEALALLEEAERAQRQLFDQGSAPLELRTELATTHNNLGLALRQAEKRDAAVAHFGTAIDLLQPSAAEADFNDEDALRVLAASYSNLGSLVGPTASDEAAENYRAAIKIGRRLVESNPVNRLYQGDLARTYNNLGFLRARARDWHNAELCYRDAISLQENLVRQSPLLGSYIRDLAVSYSNLGMVESRDQRFAAAESSFRRAIDLHERLLTAEPASADTLSSLGSVYNNRSLNLAEQQQFAPAEESYQQAIKYQEQALAAAPDNERYRERLGNHYANYAACLRRQQKLQAADEVAQRRKSLLASQPGPTAAAHQN